MARAFMGFRQKGMKTHFTMYVWKHEEENVGALKKTCLLCGCYTDEHFINKDNKFIVDSEVKSLVLPGEGKRGARGGVGWSTMGPPNPAVDWDWGGPGGVGSRGGGFPSPGGNILSLSPSTLEAGEKDDLKNQNRHEK